jgi:hypothetical protein
VLEPRTMSFSGKEPLGGLTPRFLRCPKNRVETIWLLRELLLYLRSHKSWFPFAPECNDFCTRGFPTNALPCLETTIKRFLWRRAPPTPTSTVLLWFAFYTSILNCFGPRVLESLIFVCARSPRHSSHTQQIFRRSGLPLARADFPCRPRQQPMWTELRLDVTQGSTLQKCREVSSSWIRWIHCRRTLSFSSSLNVPDFSHVRPPVTVDHCHHSTCADEVLALRRFRPTVFMCRRVSAKVG